GGRRVGHRFGPGRPAPGRRPGNQRSGLSARPGFPRQNAARGRLMAGQEPEQALPEVLRERLPARQRSVHLDGRQRLGGHGAGFGQPHTRQAMSNIFIAPKPNSPWAAALETSVAWPALFWHKPRRPLPPTRTSTRAYVVWESMPPLFYWPGWTP